MNARVVVSDLIVFNFRLYVRVFAELLELLSILGVKYQGPCVLSQAFTFVSPETFSGLSECLIAHMLSIYETAQPVSILVTQGYPTLRSLSRIGRMVVRLKY